MADNPAVQQPGTQRTSSAATTMWAVVLGWALVRLVATGERRSVPATARRPMQRPQEQGMRQNRDRDTGFSEKQHAPPHAANEPGRGRSADTPTEIPSKGWKDILWRTG
jgi:membrane protein